MDDLSAISLDSFIECTSTPNKTLPQAIKNQTQTDNLNVMTLDPISEIEGSLMSTIEEGQIFSDSSTSTDDTVIDLTAPAPRKSIENKKRNKNKSKRKRNESDDSIIFVSETLYPNKKTYPGPSNLTRIVSKTLRFIN